MTEWKTTIVGALLAAACVLQAHVQAGHSLEDWKTWIVPVGIALLGYVAKDNLSNKKPPSE